MRLRLFCENCWKRKREDIEGLDRGEMERKLKEFRIVRDEEEILKRLEELRAKSHRASFDDYYEQVLICNRCEQRMQLQWNPKETQWDLTPVLSERSFLKDLLDKGRGRGQGKEPA